MLAPSGATRRSILASVLGSATLACGEGGPGDLGAPCNTAEDCAGDLICDEHNGQASCQEPHDHGSGAPQDAGGSSAEEPGEAGALCEAFCSCMDMNCAGLDGFPYVDGAACMEACSALDDSTLACFGSFCEQASLSEPGLANHYCEHAWGELGVSEC